MGTYTELGNSQFEPSGRPWWWYRCTHREHLYDSDGTGEYGCWRVLKEAEGAAILHEICLNQVHVCVDLPNVGSMCRAITFAQYFDMTDLDELRMVQSMWRELKPL